MKRNQTFLVNSTNPRDYSEIFILCPGNELSGEHPCGDLYPGPRQITEPETIALTHYLLKLKLPIYAFITFKEGDVLVSQL